LQKIRFRGDLQRIFCLSKLLLKAQLHDYSLIQDHRKHQSIIGSTLVRQARAQPTWRQKTSLLLIDHQLDLKSDSNHFSRNSHIFYYHQKAI